MRSPQHCAEIDLDLKIVKYKVFIVHTLCLQDSFWCHPRWHRKQNPPSSASFNKIQNPVNMH